MTGHKVRYRHSIGAGTVFEMKYKEKINDVCAISL
jgi:hypothetical protein